jgi:hypothetical protein
MVGGDETWASRRGGAPHGHKPSRPARPRKLLRHRNNHGFNLKWGHSSFSAQSEVMSVKPLTPLRALHMTFSTAIVTLVRTEP